MHNHTTSACIHKKKEGCWRCGEKHMLRECQAPYVKSKKAKKEAKEQKEKGESKDKTEKTDKGDSSEQERSLLLAMITHRRCGICHNELTYPVKLQSSFNPSITVITTLDTGAQCSAIRHDVAEAAGIDWRPHEKSVDLRGVTGEKLPVMGKARLRIHAGGHISNLEA